MMNAFQLEQPDTHALSFNERFALLVDREATHRENRRLTRLLQLAHLRQQACVEDIDYKHRRGLDRAPMSQLATCDWIRSHHNLHITGSTGCVMRKLIHLAYGMLKTSKPYAQLYAQNA